MLPRCLAADRTRGGRDDHRRHRLDRPHRRDRRVVRRHRAAPRVDRRLRRRPQRLASTPPPATGSSTWTPTRCSSSEDVERLRELRRPHLARGLLPRSRPTTRATSSDGTAVNHNALRVFRNRPEYRFRAACTSRSPRRCRRTCRSGSSTAGAHRALRLPRRGARRQGEVAPQHRAARAPARRGRRRRRSCASTSAPSTPPPATPRGALAAVRARLGACSTTTPSAAPTASCPSLVSRAACKALRINGRHDEAHRAAATRAWRSSRASPTSSSSRRSCAAERGDVDDAPIALLRAVHRDGRRARRYSPTVGCGTLPRPRSCWPRSAATRATGRVPSACWASA